MAHAKIKRNRYFDDVPLLFCQFKQVNRRACLGVIKSSKTAAANYLAEAQFPTLVTLDTYITSKIFN